MFLMNNLHVWAAYILNILHKAAKQSEESYFGNMTNPEV